MRLWVEDVTTGTNASISGWHRCPGMPGGPLAPVWAKLAHALLDDGERLDGFVGHWNVVGQVPAHLGALLCRDANRDRAAAVLLDSLAW